MNGLVITVAILLDVGKLIFDLMKSKLMRKHKNNDMMSCVNSRQKATLSMFQHEIFIMLCGLWSQDIPQFVMVFRHAYLMHVDTKISHSYSVSL